MSYQDYYHILGKIRLFWYEVNHFFKDFGKQGIVDGVLLVIRNQYVDAGKDPNCQVSLELIQ